MKQFIVLLAVIPILLVLLLQFTQDQVNEEKVAFVQSVVYAAKEDAKQAGCFTEEIQQTIKERISNGLGIPEECITIIADSEPKYRYAEGDERIINYRVDVRFDGVMAGGKLLGISDTENSAVYSIESYTASEKL